MKKLNKILITGLSTAAIAGATLPLVSCNKQTKLTKEEWTKAFEPIANPRNTSRNFTLEGKIWMMMDAMSFNVKSDGAYNDGNFRESSTEEYDNYLSYVHNDIIWSLSDKPLLKPCYSANFSDFEMIGAFVTLGNIFLDIYDDVKFTDASHCEAEYKLEMPEYELVKFVIQFEFDSSKRVSKIVVIANNTEAGISIAKAQIEFSNYGSTSIEQTQKSKFDFTDREITATESSGTFVCAATTATPSNGGNAYIFDLPTDLTATDLKYLAIGNAVIGNDIDVILNGEELTKDTDYTVNTEGNLVTLKNSVTKGDKLRLIFSPKATSSNATVTLKGAE